MRDALCCVAHAAQQAKNETRAERLEALAARAQRYIRRVLRAGVVLCCGAVRSCMAGTDSTHTHTRRVLAHTQRDARALGQQAERQARGRHRGRAGACVS